MHFLGFSLFFAIFLFFWNFINIWVKNWVATKKMVEVEIYRYKEREETFLEGEEISSDMEEVKILMVEVVICSIKAHKQPR